MVATLHLTKDAKFSNKLTLELLQIPMDKFTSKVALLLINIAGFPLQSGFSLDCYIIDYAKDLVAVSEPHGQMSGFKIYHVNKCRAPLHGFVCLVNNL